MHQGPNGAQADGLKDGQRSVEVHVECQVRFREPAAEKGLSSQVDHNVGLEDAGRRDDRGEVADITPDIGHS